MKSSIIALAIALTGASAVNAEMITIKCDNDKINGLGSFSMQPLAYIDTEQETILAMDFKVETKQKLINGTKVDNVELTQLKGRLKKIEGMVIDQTLFHLELTNGVSGANNLYISLLPNHPDKINSTIRIGHQAYKSKCTLVK